MNEAITDQLAIAVREVALLLAGETEEKTVHALRAMRTKMIESAAADLTSNLIESIVVARHDLEARCPSVLSRAIH